MLKRMVTRRSPLTGKLNSLYLPVTVEQLHAWRMEVVLIQDAMPALTAEEREFVQSGYTPEDWAKIFGGEDEEEQG